MITIWSMIKAIWSVKQTSRPTGLTQTQSNSCRVKSKKNIKVTTLMLRSCVKASLSQSQIFVQTPTSRAKFSLINWPVKLKLKMYSLLLAIHRCDSQTPRTEPNQKNNPQMLEQLSLLLKTFVMINFSLLKVSSRFKRRSLMVVRLLMKGRHLINRLWRQMSSTQGRATRNLKVIKTNKIHKIRALNHPSHRKMRKFLISAKLRWSSSSKEQDRF